MLKYLFNILAALLLLSSFCFAKSNDASLQKEYGPDLTKAPFFLRFKFLNDYKKDWSDSYYNERKYFLIEYQKSVIEQQKKDKAEAKAQAQKEKELLRQKKADQRKEKDRLKQEQAEEKEEQKADADRQKELNKAVQNQRKELQRLLQEEQQSGR